MSPIWVIYLMVHQILINPSEIGIRAMLLVCEECFSVHQNLIKILVIGIPARLLL